VAKKTVNPAESCTGGSNIEKAPPGPEVTFATGPRVLRVTRCSSTTSPASAVPARVTRPAITCASAGTAQAKSAETTARRPALRRAAPRMRSETITG
jgi:hypothetical protein